MKHPPGMSFAAGVCAVILVALTGVHREPDAEAEPAPAPRPRPNIVYILADDLGFGDVHACNPDRGRIPTPHLDRLAAEGMLFTDAHACSSVCTPSRYGILTGRHGWRSRLQTFILGVYDPPLIAADRLTVPALLGRHGYRTGGTGKWHLGWEVPLDGGDVVVDRPLAEGPTSRGFDEYRCVDLRNFPPFLYTENDRFVGEPLRPFTRKGGTPETPVADDEYVDVLPTTVDWAVRFIERRAADREPFFLFVAPTAPHAPLAVAEEFRGQSGLGRYADYVMEVDAEVGRVLAAIDGSGLADDTLVIFTSDNGCAPYIGAADLEAGGHFPSGRSRGYKADLWDGGHRVPLIARWPGRVKAGGACDELVCLTDLMATCADLLGVALPDDAGEDSVSMLPLLRGEPRGGRASLIHHSITGRFALREGKWKLMLCPGSGGWAEPDDPQAEKLGLPDVQLYDMEADAGERRNLRDEHPEVVARLTKTLLAQVRDGRSTPGTPQKNDVPVDAWKQPPIRPTLDRVDNMLVVRSPRLPGGEICVNYLEAFCRAGSTAAPWGETVLNHRTDLVSRSDDGTALRLKSTVEDGLVVEHVITAGAGEVDFRLTARNPTQRRSLAHWAQACPRIGPFTGFEEGADADDYLGKCFVFLDGRLTRMPTPRWATEARYTPGQVWCPQGVPRADVNPRPLSPDVTSNGLIGCFSRDETLIWATAWEPCQELFQGVVRCLHADFRLGGLEPGASLTIRGKMYVVPADVEALLRRYEADFAQQAGRQ